MKWKPYTILQLQSDTRPIVVATSYKNLLSHIPAVRRELEQMNYKGDVLFDQLLSNGHAPNRFLKSRLSDDGLLHRYIEITGAPEQTVLDELTAFYHAHPEHVHMSSLPEPQQYALLA